MDYLHNLWLARAKDRADAVAVVDPTGRYSYNQLQDMSVLWHDYLQRRQVKQGQRLVLVSDSCFASIAVLLGSSMSAVTFTVVSPEVPESRRNSIIDDLQPALVLIDSKSCAVDGMRPASELDPVFNRFVVESLTSMAATSSWKHGGLTIDPAYIVFTSGSTGRPKGIVMSHQAIVSFWKGLIEHAGLTDDKRYASMSPLQFDFALLDIGLCLGSGATLILPARSLLHKPEKLLHQLAENEVTHISGVPTIWKIILRSSRQHINKLKKLERILFAGEHFPAENMRAIADILPKVEFYNIYGQSESIACTFHVLADEDYRSDKPHMPVGRSHRDMNLFLIDEMGRVIKQPGNAGELYIKGPTLFSGYWRRPEQTKKSLMQNPLHNDYQDMVFRTGDICYFDEQGIFYFIGRKDNQIKLNGNRVELEEIEAALNRFPGVSNSCVLVHDNTLHAALAFKLLAEVEQMECESTVRSFLNKGLPSYMLPKHYHFMKAIPVSENGKNDRNRLLNELRLEVQ